MLEKYMIQFQKDFGLHEIIEGLSVGSAGDSTSPR